MEPDQKRALAIVGVVAAAVTLVLVGGLLVRPSDDGPGGGCAPAQRDAWRERLLGGRALAAGELSGCATAVGPFTVTGACALVVAPADARLRRLELEAIDPLELRTVTDADGRQIASRATLAPGKAKALLVGKAGQTFTLRCAAVTACRARVR